MNEEIAYALLHSAADCGDIRTAMDLARLAAAILEIPWPTEAEVDAFAESIGIVP